mmetsp:Transcript_41958/g.40268  ORF Transcript_41958/g.40268 Transcript_41958/m.40268 type:complete len:108 (+) Transcript_41958:361-684(+)
MTATLWTFFIKKYNILWLMAPFLPVHFLLLKDIASPHKQNIENAYKYILTKRAATCEYEKNKAVFASKEYASSAEYKQIQGMLVQNHINLYQAEKDLLERISYGELR